jgi:hypothetical protein
VAIDDDSLQISVRQFIGGEKPAMDGYMEVLMKTIVSTALPFGIGSAITGLLSEAAQQAYRTRVAELFSDFAIKVKSIEDRIPDPAFFGGEEFLSLFVEAVDQQRTNRHREKRKLLANGLANSGTTSFKDDQEKESYFRVLRDLTPGDLVVLRKVEPRIYAPNQAPSSPIIKNPSPPNDSVLARLEGLGLVKSRLSISPGTRQVTPRVGMNASEAISALIESQAVTSYEISEFGLNFLTFLSIDSPNETSS